MDEHDEMVTILKSTDATYVESVIAMLEGEGIPVEHPGLNHAALLPGMSYVEINVRVPASRREDALAILGDALSADNQTLAQVFRVKRRRTVFGLLLGWVAGLAVIVVSRVVGASFIDGVPMVVLGVGLSVGYVFGANLRRDICSAPTCGGFLPTGAITCPKCKGTVHGEIETASDHFDALEALGDKDSIRSYESITEG